MAYTVKLTEYAIEQMEETVRYISKTLLVPDTARGWAAKLKNELSSLREMPARYPLTVEEPWHTHGIHKMSVGSFLVYYWIDEEKHTVWITAIVYGRRDQLGALRNMPQ